MAYYARMWNEAQDNLRQNIAYDQRVKKSGPIKDANRARWVIGHLFVKYVGIVNKLDECYDQIVHPQKREVIGRLLDISLGRLLEVKKDLAKIELDDYVFYDNILMELGLTPQDVEIKVPQYFWRDREKDKARRRELIQEVYDDLKEEEELDKYLEKTPEEEKEKARETYLQKKKEERLERQKQEELLKKKFEMEGINDAEKKTEKESQDSKDIADAVLLIQRHERARQNRKALTAHKKRLQLLRSEREAKIDDAVANKAAGIIQQHWRRHKRRVVARRKLEKEMLLLGMVIPSWKDLSGLEKIRQLLEHRKMIQERNQVEYEDASIRIQEEITKLYSAAMNEATTDEIRHWFRWFHLECNFLPDFPPPDLVVPTAEILGVPKKISKEFIQKNFPESKIPHKPMPNSKLWLKLGGIEPIGGSALVVAGHWIGPREFLLCQNELEKMKKGGAGEKPKKLSKEEMAALKKKQKEAERKMLEAEEAQGFRLSDSNFLVPLMKADKDYRDFWLNLDETDNYDQRYIYDLVKEDKCHELSMQVRQAVDEAMRLELDILKEALERDKHKKKKKAKKGKKGKAGKKKQKKEGKDPTGNRTVDDLFKELFRNGIIREYEEAYLRDFIGERSFTAAERRRRLEDGPPGVGDVRDLILQQCILPLGSTRIHQLSPVIRSACLVGLEHSGKEFLARIVCTETASVMFDLTPENTAGKYPGKDGLKMLAHLVEKMSRILQPSVIFVDGAEKLFYKKVPKEEKGFEPKRLGGALTKIVRNIKPQDQVLVLGISSFPWLCPKRKLTQTYDKFIFVPEADYGTHFLLWQKLLLPYHGVPREFDFSCLAKMSRGLPVRAVLDVVRQTMTPERICKGRERPFTPEEFMEELCKIEKPPDKIVKKYTSFYNSSPLRRSRLTKLQEAKEAQDKGKKKQ